MDFTGFRAPGIADEVCQQYSHQALVANQRMEAFVVGKEWAPPADLCRTWAGVPAFEAYYDSSKLWPAASLERRRAILG